MKTNHFLIGRLAILALAAFNQTLSAAPLGTAFSYQGRLNAGGAPATGIYDLRFAIYDAVSAGTQQGNWLTNSATVVSNGLFTVALDFGRQFNGEARWLEVGVQTNGGSGFSTLSPRQPLTPAPYAVFANTASNLLGALPAAQLTGTVGNGQLASSSVTVSAGTGLSGGGAVALGGSTTLNNAGVLSLTGNADITVSAASGNITLGDTATSANTASTIIKRDASGNFSAGTITANLSGNAATVNHGIYDIGAYANPDWITSLAGGKIAGDISGNASGFTGSLAGDVTGAQGTTVVSSVGGQSAANVATGASAANAATSANTPGTIIRRDGSGNFSAGAITAGSLSGDGSGLNNLNGGSIASGTVTSAQLAQGAALTNLTASGESGVPSGALLLSTNFNDANLANAGYVRLGAQVTLGDAWQQHATIPTARSSHTAVWTGTEMIIWGGYNGSFTNSGARYNPALDSWTAITTNGAPAPRQLHAAIWTGSEMIVWGGSGTGYFNDGARYNPATDSWTAMNTNNAPSPRNYFAAVWTGTEMIVWGGWNGGTRLADGGRYNPASDSWSAVTNSGAPLGRSNHSAVWSGSEMLIWGGFGTGGPVNDGGRYNPISNTWSAMTTSGAPSARQSHSAVWTGSEMIVWAGYYPPSATYNDGGRYNPASNTWSVVATSGAPSPRLASGVVWTGREILVWGGYNGALTTVFNDGGRYNPAANSWVALTTQGTPSARCYHTMVWTGAEVILHGGLSGSTYFNDTWSYALPRVAYLYQRP